MNIQQAIQHYTQQLEAVSETPRLDVEVLFCEALQWSKAKLLAYPEFELSSASQNQIKVWVQRRFEGEPIAYLVGHQPFWTLDLLVTPDTLIPRPETEHLIEWLLAERNTAQPLCVADLGVGSGAIALALASERPLWQIDAVDISAAALVVAQRNAERHGIQNVNFYQGSWFKPLPVEKRYDIIVSNPPYIADDDQHLAKLQFEPQAALVAEQQGMADLEAIIFAAESRLKPEGVLLVEHGFEQSEAVQHVMRGVGYQQVTPHQDVNGQARFVVATKA